MFRHLGKDADVQLAVQKVAGRLGGSVNALANEEDVAYSGHQSRSQFLRGQGCGPGHRRVDVDVDIISAASCLQSALIRRVLCCAAMAGIGLAARGP